MEVLVGIVETACQIAVSIRSNPVLLQKLTEEKKEGLCLVRCLQLYALLKHSVAGKNERFAEDFKTLADVLIQELAAFRITKAFPALQGRVFGEEEPRITNAQGQSVEVKLSSDQAQVLAMLTAAMSGDEEAARALLPLLTNEHTDSGWDHHNDRLWDLADLGFWIDPIDGTNVFIRPGHSSILSQLPGVTTKGLECVTVLIGAFRLSDGLSLLGVVGQPFPDGVVRHASPRLFWGGRDPVSRLPFHSPNIPTQPSTLPRTLRLLLSSSDEQLQTRLGSEEKVGKEVATATAAGAGYKFLCVLLGDSDGYVCSKPSVFAYDSCAVDAILSALGGGVFSFQSGNRIVYAPKEAKSYCHSEGIIAVRDPALLTRLRTMLVE